MEWLDDRYMNSKLDEWTHMNTWMFEWIDRWMKGGTNS